MSVTISREDKEELKHKIRILHDSLIEFNHAVIDDDFDALVTYSMIMIRASTDIYEIVSKYWRRIHEREVESHEA